MHWKIRGDRPIYQQIVEQLIEQVASGKLLPGDKVMPVRDLATEAGVNPNTMQRALTELERRELFFTQRTSGRYVTEDKEMIKNLRDEIAAERISEFLERMNQLGFDSGEVVALLKKQSGGE